jgi:hypothetical protein
VFARPLSTRMERGEENRTDATTLRDEKDDWSRWIPWIVSFLFRWWRCWGPLSWVSYALNQATNLSLSIFRNSVALLRNGGIWKHTVGYALLYFWNHSIVWSHYQPVPFEPIWEIGTARSFFTGHIPFLAK